MDVLVDVGRGRWLLVVVGRQGPVALAVVDAVVVAVDGLPMKIMGERIAEICVVLATVVGRLPLSFWCGYRGGLLVTVVSSDV